MNRKEERRNEEKEDPDKDQKRKRKIMIAILLAIIIIILGLFITHHSPPRGTSEGTLIKVVLDQDNNPVEGAVVRLATDSCGNTVIATQTTDNEGKAYFNDLDYDTYYINVSYTVNGKTFYAQGDPWEIVIIDDELIQVSNFLWGYPEKVPPRGIYYLPIKPFVLLSH